MTDAFDFEEFPIDLMAELAQVAQVVDGLPHVEVHRVVDGRFGAEGVLLFEVLLDMGRLVFDVEARLHAVGNDARSIPKGGRRRGTRESEREEQAHAIGPSEIQVLADDGFKEVPALHRPIEDLGQTDFELAEGEAMIVSRRALAGGHRPRQPLRPAVKEALDVGGAKGVAGGLQCGGVGAGEKPIVEALEANAIATEALLDPLVTVETELHGIGQVRADFQKRRPPVLIVHVEVIVVDGNRLPRKIKHRRVALALSLVGFEGPHLLLRDADEHDALAGGEPRAVFCHALVFALAALEGHDLETLRRRKLLNGRDEAIVAGFEQGWRRHGIAEMVVQEVAQTAGGLELGHIGVQIHAVDASDFERHMLTDNRVDVGRHRILLAGKTDDGTPSGTPRPLTTPDILARAWHRAGAMTHAWEQPAITASEAAPLTS